MNWAAALNVATGIVLAVVALAALLVVGISVYWASNRALRLRRIRREYSAVVARAREVEVQRQRVRDEEVQHLHERLGGWVKLVVAVEASPSGRMQITRGELEEWPAPEHIDAYLNARWPGIAVWTEEEALDLGQIIRWRDRP